MNRGFVSLVGAGPGDPGLLTVAGRDRLRQADVILYDRLANPSLLDMAPAEARRVFVGKSPEHKAMTQEEINHYLVEQAQAGLRVVRLKGGDPFVFGRGGEEALALAAAGVAFEVLPGVTSAIAAPAYAGVPVTHRGLASSFAVVTGHEDDEKEDASVDWGRLATAVDTIVVLMGGVALPSVAAGLIRGGRDPNTPAVSVEWGTLPQQRSVAATLDGIAGAVKAAGLGTPLLTVIGEVGSLHGQLPWFEGRPLRGKRVLVTRTRQQAGVLAEMLRAAGATPLELPTLEIVPVAGPDEVAQRLIALERGAYNWSVFTSVNGVEQLFGHIDAAGLDSRLFAGCMLASVGRATTAALAAHGLRADLEAVDSSADGLVASLGSIDTQGASVLLPRAEGGSPELVAGLQARGASVDELVLYESRPPQRADPQILSLVRAGRVDVATFASSSSVRNLAELLGGDLACLQGCVIASIGPQTSAAARDLGLNVTVEAREHTISGLVEVLTAYLQGDGA